jgi:hypothetical protein
VQYSVTNQLFNVTDQVKLAVRVPIPLPNPSQTLAPHANGVSDVITQTGGEGPPRDERVARWGTPTATATP